MKRQVKPKKTATHKACWYCKKWQENEAYDIHVYKGRQYRRPTCPGLCTEKHQEITVRRRAKADHKEYHIKNRQGEKYKASKKKSAAIYNATPPGRIVKKRSDQKYYSTEVGNIRCRLQRRLGEILTTVCNQKSESLSKYTTLCTKKAISEWASKFGTPEENLSKHIEHTIPVAAFAWEWQDSKTLVRANISDEELKKVWHEDNLTLMDAQENMNKATKIPPNEVLMKIRHCWPKWWHDALIDEKTKEKVARATKGNVRVLVF
jgi:hypothetical protein